MVDTTVRVLGISQFQFLSLSAHASSPISPPCRHSVISASFEVPQKSIFQLFGRILEYILLVTDRALKNKKKQCSHLILAFSCVWIQQIRDPWTQLLA